MAIDVRWVPYGGDAAVALRAAVAEAKAGEPLAPVSVVVPSNHVGVASRRWLSSGSLGSVAGSGVGLAAVTFLTVYRLAELLGAASLAGQGKRPVSTPVLAAAVRAELAAEPGLLEPVAEHPATESALVSTYRELRDLSPAALDALARTSERASEVVRLHRGARTRLEAAWSDEEDLLDAAASLAGSPAAAELGAIVVYLPQRLSQHGARLLVALAEHVPTTVVAAIVGVPEADAEVLGSLQRLGVDVSGAERVAHSLPVDADRTSILTASDSDDEVRAAVRAVVDAVRAGTRLDRIAVLHASPEPYARLAHEQLHAAGIATNGAAVVPLSARVAGRTLLELLALPAGGYRRQDVFSWLSTGPVRNGGRTAPVTAWERISRDANVVSGRVHWDHLLLQFADHADQEATRAALDDDVPDYVPDREREKAARALTLRHFVLEVIDDLTKASTRPKRWSEHAAWAQRWLHRLLGGDEHRATWADVAEQRAAERVDEALHRLGALDEVEGPVSLDVFHRTLEIELEHDLGRVGRFGDGVLVGSVEMGIGLDLDLVVILGLAEGSFPATVRDDSLLPDRERSACGDELGLRSSRVARQHRQLLGSMAGARRQLLCIPRGDLRRSVERVPSRWVLDCASAIAGTRWWAPELTTAREPWLQHVASFDHGLRHLTQPATEQEHRLRALLAAGGALAATDDARTAAGAEVVAARRSDTFTRFDGNLSTLEVPSPTLRIQSPTRLERWAACPHRHLVEDLLRAAPIENPEDDLVITPRVKGNLVHEALEHFLLSVLERPKDKRPGSGEPWSDADHELLQQIGSAMCDQYEGRGLVGRPIFWTRDRRRILHDLDQALLWDNEHRAAHRTTPMAAEMAFGTNDAALPAVELSLPDGRILRVRGRVDRIDVGADGRVHVIDYKTGSGRDAEGLSEDDPIAGGTKLQLPIYGLAGRLAARDATVAVHAEYWFVSSRGGFERVGYDVTDDVLATTVEVLDTLVRNVEAGVFPPHPSDLSTYLWIDCHTCDPDGLGTAELRKQWERKRHDPALREYVALVEPDALVEPEVLT